MDEFIKVFGGVSVKDITIAVTAVGFLFALYRKTKHGLSEYFKEEAEKTKRVNTVLGMAEEYPKMQKELKSSIEGLATEQTHIMERLSEIEELNAKRERNKLRVRLLQSYRYYASADKNPMKAWSEMEADAFWSIFKDYEDAGGDGYMHTVVQPAMNALEVVPVHEAERIASMMQSRR